MTPRVLAIAIAIATYAAHAVVAWVSPIQGDDWGHWMWANEHAHDAGGRWIVELAREYHTFSDLVAFVLARSTLAHAIVTPLVAIALVVGVFAIAMRRLPKLDAWEDVLGLVAMGAFVWIATPRCGLVWFYRPYTSAWLYGAAVALWFLAPYRCRWQPRGAWLPVLFLAGYCAGSSTPQLGTASLVAVILALHRAPVRSRWMWIGLAGVTLGTIASYANPPFMDFRGYKAAFEASLVAIDVALREGGEMIALLLGLALLRIVLGRVRTAWATETGPELGETLPWGWVWFGLTLLALCGPRYSEATRFPASLAIVIASVPILRWLVAVRPLRLLVVAIIASIHVVVWVFALRVYLPLGSEFRERIATLEHASAGSVPSIEPYREIRPSFWTFGEDFGEAGSRQLIAIRLFQLRDIEFATKFSLYEPNAHIAIRFEIEGVSDEQLARTGALPAYWGTEVVTARGQLLRLTNALERTVSTPFSARLVVENLPGTRDILRGRPLLLAVYEHDELLRLRVSRGRFDVKNALAIGVRPQSFTTDHPESYLIKGDTSTPLAGDGGRYRFAPMTTELHAVVACDPKRCFLVDAFNPRL